MYKNKSKDGTFKDKNILPLFIDNPCKNNFCAANQEMPGLLIYRKTDKPVTLTSTNPLLIDLFYSIIDTWLYTTKEVHDRLNKWSIALLNSMASAFIHYNKKEICRTN